MSFCAAHNKEKDKKSNKKIGAEIKSQVRENGPVVSLLALTAGLMCVFPVRAVRLSLEKFGVTQPKGQGRD